MKRSRASIEEQELPPERRVKSKPSKATTHLERDKVKQQLITPDIIMKSGAAAGVAVTPNENDWTRSFLRKWFKQLKRQGKPSDGVLIQLPRTAHEVNALAAIYRKRGHKVDILPPTKGLIDGHYSTDTDKSMRYIPFRKKIGKWVMNRTHSIIMKFTHSARTGELAPKRKFIKETRPEHIIYELPYSLEGGDTRIITIPSRGIILLGDAETKLTHAGNKTPTIGRSSEQGRRAFTDYVHTHISPKISIETVELRQPFYHMDTAGIPTIGGHFFTNKKIFTDASWKKLQGIFGDKLVEIPYNDLKKHFAGNGTNFGREIYTSTLVSEKAIQAMTSRGYNVTMTSIDNAMCSGGGHRCMTSALHSFVDGGLEGEDFGIRPDNPGKVYRVRAVEKPGNFRDYRYLFEERVSTTFSATTNHYGKNSAQTIGRWKTIEDITHLGRDHEQAYFREEAKAQKKAAKIERVPVKEKTKAAAIKRGVASRAQRIMERRAENKLLAIAR